MVNFKNLSYEDIITLGNSFQTEINDERELQGKKTILCNRITEILDYQYESVLDLETEKEIEEHNKQAYELIEKFCTENGNIDYDYLDAISEMLNTISIKEGIDVAICKTFDGIKILVIFCYCNSTKTVFPILPKEIGCTWNSCMLNRK